MGFVLSSPSGNVYFAWDTGVGSHFKEIGERFKPLSLAILPIGAYRSRWFMSPVPFSPDEAVQAHRILGARNSLAIHYGTFPLADDGQEEPVRDLIRALDQTGLTEEDFWVLDFGEGRELPILDGDRGDAQAKGDQRKRAKGDHLGPRNSAAKWRCQLHFQVLFLLSTTFCLRRPWSLKAVGRKAPRPA